MDPKIIFSLAAILTAGAQALDAVTEALDSRRARKVAKRAAKRRDWHSVQALGVANFSMSPIPDQADDEQEGEEE